MPLDRKGIDCDILPIGKRRVVDLRPGDWFVHRPTRKRYQLARMVAYRQHELSDELIAAGDVSADGYLVPK